MWVDASREPIAKAFQEENPDVPISIETYDGNSGGSDTFKTKMALFDQSGEGWPDVVFSTQTNDASWAAKETNGNQAFAAALNKGYLDQSFLDGFTDGALDPMTVDGTVYGLRNDLAPVVLWYNKALLDQFGYDIPKTWEDYEALSTKLAAEHPGYILGTYDYVGDDLDAAQARMEADPVMQDWWRLTSACQIPFREGSGLPNWERMTEVWHLD